MSNLTDAFRQHILEAKVRAVGARARCPGESRVPARANAHCPLSAQTANARTATARTLSIRYSQEGGAAPVRSISGGAHFAYLRHNDIYVVLVSRTNANMAMGLKLAAELMALFKSYFGVEVTEDQIMKHVSLVYELLDEVIDYGFPQNLSPEVLKLYIEQETDMLDRCAMRAVVSEIPALATGHAHPPCDASIAAEATNALASPPPAPSQAIARARVTDRRWHASRRSPHAIAGLVKSCRIAYSARRSTRRRRPAPRCR